MRLLLLPILASLAFGQSPKDLYSRAQQAVAGKQWVHAIEDCTQALAAKPGFHQALLLRAFSYSMLKQRTNAIDDLDVLLKDHPEASTFVFRGNQHLLLNQFADAAADFGEAIRLNPKSSGIYELRAHVRLKLGDSAGAVSDRARSAELAALPLPTNGGEVLKIGARVTAPHAVLHPQPGYSSLARAAKIQGTVVVSLVVDENGWARDLWIVEPLGYGLDERALEAVQKWKFVPAAMDGTPVPCMATIEVTFRLL